MRVKRLSHAFLDCLVTRPNPLLLPSAASRHAATYEVIFMTGWAPHPGQQRPAARGSATVSFEDLVKEFGEGGEPASGSSTGSGGGSSGGGGCCSEAGSRGSAGSGGGSGGNSSNSTASRG